MSRAIPTLLDVTRRHTSFTDPWDDVKGGIRDVGARERRLCAMVCALQWRRIDLESDRRPALRETRSSKSRGLYHFGNFYYASGQQISPWTWLTGWIPNPGRVMSIYRSSDFLHCRAAKAMGFARVGQLAVPPMPGQQSHMGAGMWNRGNVMVGLYGMWQDGPTTLPKGIHFPHGVRIDLGLVVSNDRHPFSRACP